jgi:hypothetical protein
VTTRLIRDELDLNLAALTAWLIIIIVVVVGGGRTLTLDTASIAASDVVAIAHGMAVVERRWRALLVVVCDVGHYGIKLLRYDEKVDCFEGIGPRCVLTAYGEQATRRCGDADGRG